MRRRVGLVALAVGLAVTGCSVQPTSSGTSGSPDASGTASSAPGSDSAGEKFPDIVEAKATYDKGTFSFDVTVSSPYDSPDRYADGWRIKGPDDTVYGTHTLAHDHAGEQPFTRTQSGVEIPDGVTKVIVEGRDQVSGFGGKTVTVTLPER